MAYVYRHIRLDKNQPFYIGIGSDDTFKRAYQKCRRNAIWNKIVAKTDFRVEILFSCISYEEAKRKEKEFIELYGRIDTGTGILSNMTDGGDGTLNKIYTEDYRKKLSDAAKARGPQDQVKKIIQWRKDNPHISEETKAKIKKALSGRKLSESHINKLKQRTGDKNPVFGKFGINSKGEILAFKNGSLVGRYSGVHDAANKLNVTATKISACLNGRRNFTGGYSYKRIYKGEVL